MPASAPGLVALTSTASLRPRVRVYHLQVNAVPSTHLGLRPHEEVQAADHADQFTVVDEQPSECALALPRVLPLHVD